jgi:hypothetical protein
MMQKILTTAAMGLALVAGMFALPGAANAGTRARSASVQGAHGRGYVRQASVTRQPGYRTASRSVRANNGRGMTSSRTASWGGGSYSGSVVRTHADRSTSSWSRIVVSD